jgi:hypothetical protein
VAASTSKKPKGGLTKWFKEDWRDLKTGKECGRKSAKGKSKRPYPSCRPKAVAQKMTAAEKRSSVQHARLALLRLNTRSLHQVSGESNEEAERN